MPGEAMRDAFNLLRPEDLIWRYVEDRYLLGHEAKPFDLLYWNSDQTNLPGPLHTSSLRRLYLENALATGAFALPRPLLHSGNLDFSFAGLKTAVRTRLGKLGANVCQQDLAHLVQVLLAHLGERQAARRLDRVLRVHRIRDRIPPAEAASSGTGPAEALRLRVRPAPGPTRDSDQNR